MSWFGKKEEESVTYDVSGAPEREGPMTWEELQQETEFAGNVAVCYVDLDVDELQLFHDHDWHLLTVEGETYYFRKA